MINHLTNPRHAELVPAYLVTLNQVQGDVGVQGDDRDTGSGSFTKLRIAI